MAKKNKVQFFIEDQDGKVLGDFYSKTATSIFSKLEKGTMIKLACDEGKDFGKQFIGTMEVKGLPDQGGSPPPQPDPNKPPVVNAGQDISVKQGTPVTLDGSAVDTDGQLERVEWHQIGLPSVQLIADSADATNVTFTAPDVPQGQSTLVLEFFIEAFDDKGASATDKIKVTVTTDTPPPPPPPEPTPGVLWTSKSWANGNARIIKGVATDPDDNQYEMRAGADVQGKKELEIDGKGSAKQTGERFRQYIWDEPGHAGSQGGAE